MRSHARLSLLGLVACGLAACSSSSGSSDSPRPDSGPAVDSGTAPDAPSTVADAGPAADAPTGTDAPAEAAPTPPASALYTMSNASAGNAILGFTRAADGSLTPMAAPFPTGGHGSGASLGEQGAVVYDGANARLYAVNAGDDSFSFFPVDTDGSLGAAVNVVASSVSGGSALVGPKSVAFHGDTVYVLFEGDASHASAIAGWTVTGGAATAVAGSIVPLSSASHGVDPAQIQFTPDGAWIVVTEKQSGASGSVAGNGSIDTFAVDGSGLATKKGFYAPAPASGGGAQMTPFGFDFVGDTLVVSEAGSTGVGTYTYAGGEIAPVAGSAQFLPTDGAPCWVAVSSDWAYVANAKGPDVSGFTVSAAGALTNIGSAKNAIVASTGETVTTDAGKTFEGPTDELVSADGQFLYVLDAAVPAIGAFKINGDGTLTRVGSADYTASSLPVGAVGLAGR